MSLLKREHFWPALSMLKNSPEILNMTARHFFELNCLHRDHQIPWKWCDSYFNTIWSHLPCCLSKGSLKRNFLDIYLTTFFGIRIFANTSAMTVILILKMFQVLSTFQKWTKKMEKQLFHFLSIASELAALNCL